MIPAVVQPGSVVIDIPGLLCFRLIPGDQVQGILIQDRAAEGRIAVCHDGAVLRCQIACDIRIAECVRKGIGELSRVYEDRVGVLRGSRSLVAQEAAADDHIPGCIAV